MTADGSNAGEILDEVELARGEIGIARQAKRAEDIGGARVGQAYR